MFPRILLVVLLGSITQPGTEPQAKPGAADEEAIRRLIKQLGSDSFAAREAASRRLDAIGEPALPALREAATNPDLEVRRRAEQVLRAVQLRVFGDLRQVRRVPWMDTVQRIPAHIYHTAFSPDSRSYIAGGDIGPLRLWDVATGQQLREFTGHQGWVNASAFSPDGKKILSGGTDRTLRLWDVASGQQLQALQGHTGDIHSVGFSPDGRLALSAAQDRTVRVWDLTAGKELRRLEGHGDWCGASFSPDGTQVLSYSGDKTIRLWSTATGASIRVLEPFKDAIGRNGVDVEVKAFFLAGGRQFVGYVCSKDPELVIWDTDSGREVRRLKLGADLHREVAISPDGRTFLSGHEDRTVRLRDLATGQEISRIQFVEKHLARGLSFAPDGRHAASGSWRGFVYLFRLRD